METTPQTQPTRQAWITPQVYDLTATDTQSGVPSPSEGSASGRHYGPVPS